MNGFVEIQNVRGNETGEPIGDIIAKTSDLKAIEINPDNPRIYHNMGYSYSKLNKHEEAVNAYNTRSSTMAGKLPAGPIATISEGSISAVLNAPKTDYIYFIANIKTGETFFYTNAREFEAKKAELSKINGGL